MSSSSSSFVLAPAVSNNNDDDSSSLKHTKRPQQQQHHHHRHTNRSSTNTLKTTKRKKKIIIRTYEQPPSVPPNFYEQQSHFILRTTFGTVLGDAIAGMTMNATTTSMSTMTTTSVVVGGSGNSLSGSSSLQQAHDRVVDLVTCCHMGPEFYMDLVACLKDGASRTLSSMSSTTTTNNTTNTSQLLDTIARCYNVYCHYLSVVRHVCLPLDRQYVWNSETETAILRNSSSTPTTTTTAATASSSSTPSSSSSTTTLLMMSLWQVGLHQFALRLSQLGLDEALYNVWWNELWYTSWKNQSSSLQSSSSSQEATTCCQRLATTMRMWQELGLKHSILKTKLHPQLVQHLQHESQVTYDNTSMTQPSTTSSSLSLSPQEIYVLYVETRWNLISTHWSTFLPKLWLRTLLLSYLIRPHLTEILSNLKLESYDDLLHVQRLHQMLLLKNTTSSTTTASTTTTTKTTSSTSRSTTPSRRGTSASAATAGGGGGLFDSSGGGATTTTTTDAQGQLTRAIVTCALEKGKRSFPQAQATSVKGGAGSGGSTTTTTTTTTSSSSSSIVALLELQWMLQQLQQLLHTALPLKQVFDVLMAEPQAAEALAKYMDVTFKSSNISSSSSSSILNSPPTRMSLINTVNNTATTSAAANATSLEQVLSLFVHVSAKDVFEAFYKRDLAKRLLGGRVQNMDLEKHFLSLLKSECGAGYTSKMEGMFQDVEWSKETMARYTPPSTSSSSSSSAVALDVQVLTTGYWPMYPSYSLVLPECLQVLQQHFGDYYKKTYQGRRIRWQYALGHVTVKAKFAKQYDLVMGLSLGLVLLCFNDKDRWTLVELQNKIGLTDRAEMERILITLSLGKVKLLKKWDHDAQSDRKPRADVHNDDWFTVNEEFSSPLKKIKVSTIARHDTSREERQKTMEMISRDRLYLLDAVLVRIMKARKTMLHSELVPLVMEHAKVPVTTADVKGRIESLMDREYLERDKNDRNRYNYLA